MKMNKFVLFLTPLILTACALTPEQQAERAAAQKRYEQDLQVQLANQCDAETAQLMRDQFDGKTFATEKEKQDFRLKYVEKINEPMFQSCYKMAWQNYTAQLRLRQIQQQYYFDDNWGWHRPFFPRPPFFW